MNTPTKLPNGQLCFPMDDIPPSEITWALLSFGKDYQAIVTETDDLLNGGGKGANADIDFNNLVNEGIAAGKKTAPGPALVRALDIGAFCRHSWDMLGVETALDRLTEEELNDVCPNRAAAPRRKKRHVGEQPKGGGGAKLGTPSKMAVRMVELASRSPL